MHAGIYYQASDAALISISRSENVEMLFHFLLNHLWLWSRPAAWRVSFSGSSCQGSACSLLIHPYEGRAGPPFNSWTFTHTHTHIRETGVWVNLHLHLWMFAEGFALSVLVFFIPEYKFTRCSSLLLCFSSISSHHKLRSVRAFFFPPVFSKHPTVIL